MLLAMLVWITLCTVVLLGYYLWCVPEGPNCPRCGGSGRAAGAEEPDAATPAPLHAYLVRAWCPACGWHGLMRHQAASGLVMRENTECGRGP